MNSTNNKAEIPVLKLIPAAGPMSESEALTRKITAVVYNGHQLLSNVAITFVIMDPDAGQFDDGQPITTRTTNEKGIVELNVISNKSETLTIQAALNLENEGVRDTISIDFGTVGMDDFSGIEMKTEILVNNALANGSHVNQFNCRLTNNNQGIIDTPLIVSLSGSAKLRDVDAVMYTENSGYIAAFVTDTEPENVVVTIIAPEYYAQTTLRLRFLA